MCTCLYILYCILSGKGDPTLSPLLIHENGTVFAAYRAPVYVDLCYPDIYSFYRYSSSVSRHELGIFHNLQTHRTPLRLFQIMTHTLYSIMILMLLLTALKGHVTECGVFC